MNLWKSDKKFGQGPPPPHLDKIQKSSNFFSWNHPLCWSYFLQWCSLTEYNWCNLVILHLLFMWEDIIREVPITQAAVPTNTRRRSAKCLLRAVGVVPCTELDDKWVKELSSASYTVTGSPKTVVFRTVSTLRCLLCLYTSSTPGHQRLWCVTWEGVGGLVTAAAIHYSHLPTQYTIRRYTHFPSGNMQRTRESILQIRSIITNFWYDHLQKNLKPFKIINKIWSSLYSAVFHFDTEIGKKKG